MPLVTEHALTHLAVISLSTALARYAALAKYYSQLYQDFIDMFPIDRFAWAAWEPFGATHASRWPSIISKSDWYVSFFEWEDRIEAEIPRTVIVYGSELGRLMTRFGPLDVNSSESLIVWGDQMLSSFVDENNFSRWKSEELGQFFGKFRTVSFQAKDIPVPGIRTAPIGLAEAYLRSGVMEKAIVAIQGSAVHLKSKQVLVSEGMYIKHYFDNEEDALDQVVVASRRACLEWARSPAAQLMGVELRRIDRWKWWGQLSEYRFLLAPHSLGLQTTKIVEALLVLTVPILQRASAFDDLAAMGFPIAIVDDWSQINAETLEQWWNEKAPRLWHFRHYCLTSTTYWRFLTGQLDYCE